MIIETVVQHQLSLITTKISYIVCSIHTKTAYLLVYLAALFNVCLRLMRRAKAARSDRSIKR